MRVLSVKIKGWKPKPAKKSVKVRYQWLKNGKKIKGAKKATYRLRAKDLPLFRASQAEI